MRIYTSVFLSLMVFASLTSNGSILEYNSSDAKGNGQVEVKNPPQPRSGPGRRISY